MIDGKIHFDKFDRAVCATWITDGQLVRVKKFSDSGPDSTNLFSTEAEAVRWGADSYDPCLQADGYSQS